MIIFDPSRDYVDSKDIPCNNWLHFIIRNNRLHMSVVIRSNDVMWGFSGINAFEWSVLHEMMAYWTNSVVGDFSYFISSFHLYSYHYKRAQKILAYAKDKTLYDFGFTHAPFQTPLELFDDTLLRWFEWERRIRDGIINTPEEIAGIKDEFLQNCAQMLYIFNRYKANASLQEIADLVTALPSNDFKIAAIEYITRNTDYKSLIKLSIQEENYFHYFRRLPLLDKFDSFTTCSIEKIYEILGILHYKKTLLYKDSWKKHGEVIGVFANISRKYDRIESIVIDGVKATTDESLVDTLADLAVYAAKYLTYLAENYSSIFHEFVSLYPPIEAIDAYSHNLKGFDHVAGILIRRYKSSGNWARAIEYSDCYEMIRTSYKSLDDLLIFGNWRANDFRKCTLAADLSISAVHYISLISQREPQPFYRFVNFVNTL